MHYPNNKYINPSCRPKPLSASYSRALRRRTAGEADGKELLKMHGYDCYDYGARHSYTALGRFTTIDPLAEKYYGISPYALCAGNPARMVDPDGRAPWDNKNIRDAYDAVNKTPLPNSYRVELVDGKYGKDAQMIYNETGEVVKTFEATPYNQRMPVTNILSSIGKLSRSLDAGGGTHGGNTTYTTKQDVAVATGVVGTLTGGMSLVGGALIAGGISVAGGTISAAGILNSIDDIGTNVTGESLLQQSISSDTGKQVVQATKTAISVTNVITDILNNRNLLGAMDIINNIVSIVTSYTNENK